MFTSCQEDNSISQEITDNNIDDDNDGYYEYIMFVDDDNDFYGTGDPQIIETSEIILGKENYPEGYSLFDGDCDDTNPLVNPEAIEILANSVDENCDQLIESGEFPFSVGNKWYYEGRFWVTNNINSEGFDYIVLRESIEELIIDNKKHFKIKETRIIEGQEDQIIYHTFRSEFWISDFTYLGSELIFDDEVITYVKDNSYGDREILKNVFSAEFGRLSYITEFDDDLVSRSDSYYLKGCILNGVHYGDTSELE
jgi:hypothetical protein